MGDFPLRSLHAYVNAEAVCPPIPLLDVAFQLGRRQERVRPVAKASHSKISLDRKKWLRGPVVGQAGSPEKLGRAWSLFLLL